jgi:hypothetical protein
MDANVLIQASKGPYKFDRVPQFWTFISEQLELGNVRSPKMVYDELTDGNDHLAQWCKQRRKSLCVGATKEIQKLYGEIANHVHGNYAAAKAHEFLRGADGWVIAYAMDMGTSGIVVTQESTRHRQAKVKVPTVCSEFDVKCVNTYDMLEALDFRIT